MNIDDNYLSYSKISDQLFVFGGFALKMNVNLYTQNYNKQQNHFHKEFGFADVHGNDKITIKRNYDFFLSIEELKVSKSGFKEYVIIGLREIPMIRLMFNNAMKWFNSEEHKNLYVMIEDKMILQNTYTLIQSSPMPGGKYIILEPCVIELDNKYEAGVKIIISNLNNYVEINLYSFMALVDIFNSINLIQTAQIMINYLGRPELGTNLHVFNKNSDYYSDTKQGRKSKGRINKFNEEDIE